MRQVHFRDQCWKFSKNGNLLALRTGSDCCTEHECGVAPLFKHLGVNRNRCEGLDRYRPQLENARGAVHLIERDGVVGVIANTRIYPERPEETDRLFDLYLRQCALTRARHVSLEEVPPFVAWDEEGFVILCRVENAQYAEAIKLLHEAFQTDSVFMGGEFPEIEMKGGGIGLYIEKHIDNRVIREADALEREKCGKARALKEAADKEGFDEVCQNLRKAGLSWFYLKPQRLNEDGTVMYWLNPCDQHKNGYGGYGIDDLKLWIEGKGPIPIQR